MVHMERNHRLYYITLEYLLENYYYIYAIRPIYTDLNDLIITILFTSYICSSHKIAVFTNDNSRHFSSSVSIERLFWYY